MDTTLVGTPAKNDLQCFIYGSGGMVHDYIPCILNVRILMYGYAFAGHLVETTHSTGEAAMTKLSIDPLWIELHTLQLRSIQS